MSLLGGWLLAPLVLVTLCCGLGMLVERAAAIRLPGALVPPVGLAVLIATAGLPVQWDATAEFAAPLVAVLAVAGFVLGRPWRDERVRAAWPWVLGLAVASYAVYAAPSLLSGQGSIAGYVRLDDSAIWLATIDRAMEHGRNLAGVPLGSYARTLEYWLGSEYPIGGFLPLGVTARLSGQDAANAYQPVIAVGAAMLALGMYGCLRPLLRSRAFAAGAAFVAVQASMLFGYTQWGGLKEICAVALLPPLAWLAVRGGRALTPLVVVSGALGGVLGLAALAWALPALAVGVLVTLLARPPAAQVVRNGLLLVALLAVVLMPALTTLQFTDQVRHGAISNQGEIGNLIRPPPLLQGAGLWPVGDLRIDPDPRALATVLALLCLAGAAAAVVVGLRRRALQLPALTAIALLGCGAGVIVGSPWVDAKALAIFAPVPLLGAAALAAVLLEGAARTRRALGLALAGALVLGCGWSTADVVLETRVAPRERLAELRDIGTLIAGRGPTLQLDYDVYGNRWFLRDAAPDGATDLRQRHVRGVNGQDFAEHSSVEVDDIIPEDVWPFTIIVRRRAPLASQPPYAFRRIWAGRFWEAWERPAAAPPPLKRLKGGTTSGLPAASISCKEIADLARTPGAQTLATVVREVNPVIADLATGGLPPEWKAAGVRPVVDGDGAVAFQLPQAGRWRVWVQGSVLGSLELFVDGRPLGKLRHETSHAGQWLRFGAAQLPAGAHTVVLRYERGPFWRGGRGRKDEQLPLGPVVMTPEDAEREQPVTRIPASDYRQLCGKSLDWIEVLGAAAPAAQPPPDGD